FPAGSSTQSVQYALDDIVRLKGPWLGLGLSYRVPLTRLVSLRPRIAGGALFARSIDPISGSAAANGETVRVSVQGASDSGTSASPFALTELGAEAAFGSWRIGAALGLLAVLSGGPAFSHGDTFLPPASCAPANPRSVGCAPAWPALRGEKAYSPFLSV